VGNAQRYEFMQNEMGAVKKYTVGRYLKGSIESDVEGLKMGSTSGYGADMTNLQENEELSLFITEKLAKADLFKLYILKRFDTLDNYSLTPDTNLKGLLDRNSIQ
jgi:hypothetical protein